ncbi:PPC domain-containing DNA-binding protein [Neobacillus sp. M.A.Huq-85]|nr:DNA-binding protein [Neobacillus cucumis]
MSEKRQSVYNRDQGVIWGTLAKGQDLMQGLLEDCEYHGVDTGMVNCIGSLEQAHYVYGTKDHDGQPAYSDPVTIQGVMEILQGTGFICRNQEGKLDLHFHGLVIDQDGQIRGGHFLKGKNIILVTLEYSILVGQGIDAVRAFRPELGFQTIQYRGK